MKNRLHNPCITCKEYDFCRSIQLPCERRERYLRQRQRIRAHIKEVMRKAKEERDHGKSEI